ncbi:MAG: ammonia-forming cytochrome c nitrite reductase subunit c552, partial [Planctomycetales bacterium]|nr:ammonia-forming cytochrome c nitrite reductase subunit c552 [Planctomycetales bacterium]
SEGASCMNCHMPRINEGLEAVVRTHMIYSPTDASMIESNHPNACNLCHTDRSIDWTTEHLTQWYGAKFSEDKISKSYSNRTEAVARGWMNSDNEAVRLVGADAACRANDRSLLPSILRILDDPYLLNRQFAAMGIERLLGIQLDEYGYSFYMSSAERQAPLKQLREQFLDAK